jgi:hypothetical protein
MNKCTTKPSNGAPDSKKPIALAPPPKSSMLAPWDSVVMATKSQLPLVGNGSDQIVEPDFNDLFSFTTQPPMPPPAFASKNAYAGGGRQQKFRRFNLPFGKLT